jgi:cytochrome P450
MATQAIIDRDYFTDNSVNDDPYAYFAEIRKHGPVYRDEARGLVMVTGYAEAVDVLRNSQDFSSVITTGGPTLPLPFAPDGEDITDQIEAYREQIPGTNLLVAQDDTRHGNARALLNNLFVPSRLKANEVYIKELADDMVAQAVARGGCDLVNEIATPFVTLVVADLLGVPAHDREKFRAILDSAPGPADSEEADERGAATLDYALERMAKFFAGYVMERRASPANDVLTELATATFPDGTAPDVMEIVTLAVFLFAAGGDTSAKLLSNSVRILAEDPELQRQVRADRSQIPGFLEEVLRIEGSTKCTFRLVKRKSRVGELDVFPGDKIVILLSATSHDPRRWENPTEFIIGRPKIKEHLAFGRGKHTCVGAPLARVEVRVILNSLFDQTTDISLSEEHHGPVGARSFNYQNSFIIRGLETLQIKLAPN